jgi:hypothetical protein
MLDDSTITVESSPEIILAAKFFFFILVSFLSCFFLLTGRSVKDGYFLCLHGAISSFPE